MVSVPSTCRSGFNFARSVDRLSSVFPILGGFKSSGLGVVAGVSLLFRLLLVIDLIKYLHLLLD